MMEFVKEWGELDDNQISRASNEFQAQQSKMTLIDDKVHHFYLKKLGEIDLSLA